MCKKDIYEIYIGKVQMKKEFTLNSLKDFAIKIEKTAVNYYTALFKHTENKALSDIFLKIKHDEERHVELFSEIFDLSIADTSGNSKNTKQGFVNYENDFIKNMLFDFDNIDLIISGYKNKNELLDYCIKLEKYSLEFYSNLCCIFSDDDNKVIDEIIAQEKSHIEILASYKD